MLFDGLDEVEPSARSSCVEAINAYRVEHFVPLVVCSRSREYLEQDERLRLPVAVEVRPLTPEQVDTYLKGAGKPMAAVRAALRGNAVLRDLVTTPLMLSVVMLAYRGKAVKDLPQLGSAEEQLRQVFDHYVTGMLESRARMWHYASHKTRRWLIWLAQQMKQRGLTEFYVERLQPTWLPTKRVRIGYQVIVVLLIGLGFALGIVLGGTVSVRVTDAEIDEQMRLEPNQGIRSSGWNALLGGLVFGLVGGLVFGLVFGLVGGLVFGLVFGLV